MDSGQLDALGASFGGRHRNWGAHQTDLSMIWDGAKGGSRLRISGYACGGSFVVVEDNDRFNLMGGKLCIGARRTDGGYGLFARASHVRKACLALTPNNLSGSGIGTSGY